MLQMNAKHCKEKQVNTLSSNGGVAFGRVPSLDTVFCVFQHNCLPRLRFFMACLDAGSSENRDSMVKANMWVQL